MTAFDLMAAFYAAVTSIENGQIGEVEIESAVEYDGREERVSISVRREVRQLMVTHTGADDDD